MNPAIPWFVLLSQPPFPPPSGSGVHHSALLNPSPPRRSSQKRNLSLDSNSACPSIAPIEVLLPGCRIVTPPSSGPLDGSQPVPLPVCVPAVWPTFHVIKQSLF